MKPSIRLAVKVSAIYFLVGMIWIFFSDRLLFRGLSLVSPALIWMQIGKGWVYVAATAGLLFAMVSRWARRLDHCAIRYERIVEGTETLILELDLQDRVLFANPCAKEFFGEAVKPQAPSPLPQTALQPSAGARVVEHRRADGREAWVAWTCRPMPQGISGGKEGLLCVGVDVTAKYQAEAELADEREKLRQAQKMEAIGALTSGIAHDFNNLLAIIMSHTELALLQTSLDAPARPCLEQALQGAIKGRELVGQLLAFSRPEAHRERFRPIEFGTVVRESLTLLRPTLPKGIDLREEINSQAPVLADPTQVHQVVQNLCINAVQAMEGKGRLCVRVEERTGAVALLVSDTGQGIDPAIRERLFEPYFTTKRLGEGTGLGLAVVHGILKRHGASITLRSTPGQGTTFEVIFRAASEIPEAIAS